MSYSQRPIVASEMNFKPHGSIVRHISSAYAGVSGFWFNAARLSMALNDSSISSLTL
jgi:hypothetical protein